MKRRDRLVSRLDSSALRALRAPGRGLWALAVAVSGWSLGCAQSSPVAASLGDNEQPIVGGQPARAKAYPWMVALFQQEDSERRFMCGGTLIDATHVLTAAHCSTSTELDEPHHLFVTTTVDAGQVVLARRPRSRAALADDDFIPVRNVLVHPRYDDYTVDYDVAVWELDEPVDLDEYPRLMTQPGVLDWLAALHVPARVLGYGARSEEDEEGSDGLLQVDVPLVSREACREDYTGFMPDLTPEETITERMICAGSRAGGKDSCYGDSGGPLLLLAPGKAPLLSGLVSWGAECGDPDHPGVYTSVAAVADFVGACQAGECETRAPRLDCEYGYLDCDEDLEGNGCEALLESPARCGTSCDAPVCRPDEACIIGGAYRCAPAKPVVPRARCVEPANLSGGHRAWFSLDNRNEGAVQVPLADQHFSDGARPLMRRVQLPPGLLEYAVLVALQRRDAGTFTLRGPDGVERSASISADTPTCGAAIPVPRDRLASEPAPRVRRAARSRSRPLR